MLYRASKPGEAKKALGPSLRGSMNVELNPKLLDVVEFQDSTSGATVKRRGTIVETFGDHPNVVLIEIADSQGVPLSYVTQKRENIKIVWASEPQVQEPTLPEAEQHFEKGILFLQNGLFARAKDHFSKAFTLDENLRASLLSATNALVQKGKLDAAIRVYGLILELQPQYELARQNLSAAYVARGIKLGRAGRLNQAVEDFNRALMLRSSKESLELIRKNLVAAYTQLGIRYSDHKQYQDAVSHFLVALELDPSDVTQRNLAIALVASSAAKAQAESQPPDAEFFRQAIQMGLTFSECMNAYAATLAAHGRISEARRALETAVQADPKNELAKKNLETISQQEIIPGDLMTGLIRLESQELRLAHLD
jgi:tetratricopeptide (TPR) repeat protein